MNMRKLRTARLGVPILILVSSALIFVSGCGSSSSKLKAAGPQNIYVTQANSVMSFPLTASGNVAPANTITGTNTGIGDPHHLAFDASGNMYVTSAATTSQPNDSVLVYAPGATGNATPTTTISGTNTGFAFPNGIALDAHGNIYVTNYDSASVTIFAAGASGNATPTATIVGAATGLGDPHGIAVDANGNIYVANYCVGNPCAFSVTIFAAGATGNATPTATITGAATGLNFPHGLALDSAGNIYVSSESNGGTISDSVVVFATGANGNATPTATISGAATGISHPNGISLDAKGNIYVGNAGNSSVTIFAAGATGNATPTATIIGANTGLTTVHGLTVH